LALAGLPIRAIAAATASAAALALSGCGGGSDSAAAAVPHDPAALAAGLAAADQAWRQAGADWLAGEGPGGAVPDQLAEPAAYVRQAMRMLAGRPRLARQTARRMPRRLARETLGLSAAARDLRKLSAGAPPHKIRFEAPPALDDLLRFYGAAQRRFHVGLRVLAAVNLVESAFGRARSPSTAGAKGPMQFIPSTWQIYGLGGDIHDPHDSILGAANFLHQAGAPASYGQALYAYNPSRLYVDAVLRYARLIKRDRAVLYLLYSWPSP
jgi:membrane-bound lytic murein transglycosylase B